MAPVETTDQTQTRLVDRLKRHFDDRLVDLVELPSDPYGDQGEGQYFVVILQDEGYERDRARREALQVQHQFDLDTEYQSVTTVYVLSTSEMRDADTGIAQAVRTEGVSV